MSDTPEHPWAAGRTVIRLPDVPDEAHDGYLVGKNGNRYRWVADGVWESVDQLWRGRLGHLLEREGGPVLVERREPRTWSKLDPVPTDLTKVEVNGKVWTREQPMGMPGSRWTDGWGDRATFPQLRASGEVKEVLD